MERPPRGPTYFDLGDFTLDEVERERYQLHGREEAGCPREITEAEAQAALRQWGILNDLANLPLHEAERYIRQIRVARFCEKNGDKALARAFVEEAVTKASRVGLEVAPVHGEEFSQDGCQTQRQGHKK